jgi:methylated-DNA-protein-cysteine methyltransferase-like protein
MQMPPDPATYYQTVWDIVCQIPEGQVATYGQIAGMIPPPESVNPPDYDRIAPRWVGYAMNAVSARDERSIPWWRVINSKGGISLAEGSFSANQQRTRLEGEGVVFNEKDQVDFKLVGWNGPDEAWLNERGLSKPRPLRKPPAEKPTQMNLL